MGDDLTDKRSYDKGYCDDRLVHAEEGSLNSLGRLERKYRKTRGPADGSAEGCERKIDEEKKKRMGGKIVNRRKKLKRIKPKNRILTGEKNLMQMGMITKLENAHNRPAKMKT